MTGPPLDAGGSGSVVALLLAAGLGSRFDAGGRRNKLLARLPDGQTIVTASARALLAAVEHVGVVVPQRGLLLEAALSDLPVRLIRNTRAKDGIGASIAVGVAALRSEFPDARGWLIALGDMPFIGPETIRKVAASLAPVVPTDPESGAAIVAPIFGQQRGHPVGFPRCFDAELTALDGDVGAQALMRNHAVRLVPCDDPGVLRDIDTKDDLARVGAAVPPEPPHDA